MPGTILEAYKEAMASNDTRAIPLITLEFDHATLPNIYVVHAVKDYDLTLENGTTQTFSARPFSLQFGAVDKNSNPSFNLQVDNVDLQMMQLIKAVQESGTEVQVKVRPYLSNDLTKPQLTKVPTLRLSNAKITKRVLTARLAYPELANKKIPGDVYTTTLFPGL